MRINLFFYRLLSTILLILSGFTVTAQQAGMEIDFFGYIDNREYKAPYTTDKTILGTMVSPKFFFAIDSNHRIVGGIHYNQDFGKHRENKDWVKPIVYYNYRNKNFDFAIGHLPRYERLKDVPRMALADTFMYDRPNIEGMYLAYQKGGFKQSFYIDWLSEQSKNQRERFVVGTSGMYKRGRFFFANDVLLYHNALTSNDTVDQHIQDNGLVLLRLGADWSGKTFLDSLTVDAGFAFGFDRVRATYGMQYATGFLSNIYLGYKRFSLANTLYLGEAQNLPLGDSFYHRKRYDRIDLAWTPFRKGNLEAKLVLSAHLTPDGTSNQQAFTLRYRFGKTFWR
ncbi:hypothetical protein [Sphingobacterium psychroaquaticum]|uniref:Porin n=1 Tax=Sphingobacterium psychroaquaticum TaxID=561061 RepID=A0A1X7I097_9SPHI|nr:hypothetical protein [Sphingobacterium psychroaquaticum]SMG07595.1 hypothetical protein SAMN05660862_0291 [Sphingobacterium psychroaquaticum]